MGESPMSPISKEVALFLEDEEAGVADLSPKLVLVAIRARITFRERSML